SIHNNGLSWLGRDRLQISKPGCLKVWELDEQGKAASVRWRRQGVEGVSAWSPDGTRLACVKLNSSPPVIQIEDGSGRVEASLPTSNLNGWMLAWSPDGKRLATKAADAGKPRQAGEARPVLTIWDACTGKSLVTCRVPDPIPKQHLQRNSLVWS